MVDDVDRGMSGDNSCSKDVPNKYSGFEEGTFRSDAKTSSNSFLYQYHEVAERNASRFM